MFPTIESRSNLLNLSPCFFFLQFHFNVVKDVNTDTTVVPQGVVAAMKALREKKGNSKGNLLDVQLKSVTDHLLSLKGTLSYQITKFYLLNFHVVSPNATRFTTKLNKNIL